MAVTEEVRSGLIGLSVVMLGSAPGTDRLNEWVKAVNDGMTIEDIANHIADSDAYKAIYPSFLTNEEFASSMLDATLGGEISEALMSAAVGVVTGILDEGTSRGQLALQLMIYLNDVLTQGEDHPGFADFGAAATALYNKLVVAEYYTVALRQSGPNSRVLRDVTSEVGLEDIRANFNEYLDPSDPIYLTTLRDNIEGGAAADLIIAEPDGNDRETLNSFDSIDGGGGNDTLEIFFAEDLEIDVNGADVRNVENVYLSARGKIDANLTRWEGLETVTLGRFGNTSDVDVSVAGATVEALRTFGGETVTVTGAGGELSLTVGEDTAVSVNSSKQTTGVSIMGGASVTVNSASTHSDTLISASLDETGRDLGAGDTRGLKPIVATISATNTTLTPSETVKQFGTYSNNTFTPVAGTTTETWYEHKTQPAGLAVGRVVVTKTRSDAAILENSGDKASVHLYSNVLGELSLSNNDAIVVVSNNVDSARDLALTVDAFGSHFPGALPGELRLGGKSAVENVSIDVAGDSDFSLASGAKAVTITGAGSLTIGLLNAAGEAASDTVEGLTLTGGVVVEVNVDGMSKLETIDAGASSGANDISGVGGAVTEVQGGSGNDSIAVSAFASSGIAVDLGAGDDTFAAGAAGNKASSVDGGEGTDVLRLKVDDGAYKDDQDNERTIFSNFEILDIGGSNQAEYDVALLGVNAVQVTGEHTGGTVTLNNMADGMGITMVGSINRLANYVKATIVHDLADRKAGDPRYSGVLELSLIANGGPEDTKNNTLGETVLDLTVDREIEVLRIDAIANVGGAESAAEDRPDAGDYRTTVTLHGPTNDNASVEAIYLSGNAKLYIDKATRPYNFRDPGQFAKIKLVDASESTGGVVIDITYNVAGAEFIGSSADDSFAGTLGDDKIYGGDGDDILYGVEGDDTIHGGLGADSIWASDVGKTTVIYLDPTESQVKFDKDGTAYGHDELSYSTDLTLSLGESLFKNLTGNIKRVRGEDQINQSDGDDAGTPDSLLEWLSANDNGKGVFLTVTPNPNGFGNEVTRHSVVDIGDFDRSSAGFDFPESWYLIDVDNNGDFDASIDMVLLFSTYYVNNQPQYPELQIDQFTI